MDKLDKAGHHPYSTSERDRNKKEGGLLDRDLQRGRERQLRERGTREKNKSPEDEAPTQTWGNRSLSKDASQKSHGTEERAKLFGLAPSRRDSNQSLRSHESMGAHHVSHRSEDRYSDFEREGQRIKTPEPSSASRQKGYGEEPSFNKYVPDRSDFDVTEEVQNPYSRRKKMMAKPDPARTAPKTNASQTSGFEHEGMSRGRPPTAPSLSTNVAYDKPARFQATFGEEDKMIKKKPRSRAGDNEFGDIEIDDLMIMNTGKRSKSHFSENSEKKDEEDDDDVDSEYNPTQFRKPRRTLDKPSGFIKRRPNTTGDEEKRRERELSYSSKPQTADTQIGAKPIFLQTEAESEASLEPKFKSLRDQPQHQPHHQPQSHSHTLADQIALGVKKDLESMDPHTHARTMPNEKEKPQRAFSPTTLAMQQHNTIETTETDMPEYKPQIIPSRIHQPSAQPNQTTSAHMQSLPPAQNYQIDQYKEQTSPVFLNTDGVLNFDRVEIRPNMNRHDLARANSQLQNLYSHIEEIQTQTQNLKAELSQIEGRKDAEINEWRKESDANKKKADELIDKFHKERDQIRNRHQEDMAAIEKRQKYELDLTYKERDRLTEVSFLAFSLIVFRIMIGI
jgi:hypothetical protein